MAIEKIIHQIWFQGYSQIPTHLKEYSETWKELNKNYKYTFWDSDRIDELLKNINVKWISDTYNELPLMIQKIDFAKYIILYYIGGIYIDIDVKCLKSLDTIIEKHHEATLIVSEIPKDNFQRFIFYITGTRYQKIYNNGIIMCEKENSVLFNTIQLVHKYKNNSFKNYSKFLYIFYSTGPLVLTEAVYNQKDDNLKDNQKVVFLDQSYLEACDIGQLKYTGCEIPEHAIGIHYYESAWVSDNEKFLLKIYYNMCEYKFYILLLIVFFYIYYTNTNSKRLSY